MPEELPPFPDLASPAARATVPPPFEEIVGRAKRRRRRVVLAAAAATAAALAIAVTGAALTVGDRDAAPGPVDHPGPRPSGSSFPSTAAEPPPDADTIIRTGHLVSFAAGPAGALLTVWQTCTEDEMHVCHAAWQLQAQDGTRRQLVPGESPSAHRAGDAFVVKAWNRPGILVTLDGSVRPLVDGTPRAVGVDDALVTGRTGLIAVDGRTGQTWPIPPPAGIQRLDAAAVAADGTLWATGMAPSGEVWLAWNAGRSWEHHVMPADQRNDSLPAYVAVGGDHVVSVSGYDGATILPVADYAVSTDGGATWKDLHQRDLPFDFVDAIAASSGGTLYVAAEDGHGGRSLFRTTDDTWTHFAEVTDPGPVDALAPSGDQVIAQGGTYDDPVLLALDDRGRATPVTLTR
jgi:hypothetical protein